MFDKLSKNLFDTHKSFTVVSEQVVVCVPTNGLVHAAFAFSLINAIRYTEAQGVPVVLDMDAGTVLSNQRQVLLDTAINRHQADHIMWFDSDMTFPEDTIVRLLEHKKDVICATYSKRTAPFHPTAFYNIDPVEPVDTLNSGLVKVNYTGMGCLLIKADVIDHVPSPHFPLIWHAPTSTWQGEDMGFCQLLTANGFEIWCDLDLSRLVGHLGVQEFYVNQAS